MSFCHHFASVVRPSTITKNLFSSETTWPLKDKLWWNGPLVISFQNYGPQFRHPNNMAAVTKNKKGVGEILLIFISETTGPIGNKLCLDSPWMIPFQNCVRQSRLPTNTVAKDKKGGMKYYFFSL